MNKRAMILAGAMAFLLSAYGSPALAVGFASLQKSLEALTSRLDAMESAQQKQMGQLRSRLEGVGRGLSSLDVQGIESNVAGLREEVRLLADGLAESEMQIGQQAEAVKQQRDLIVDLAGVLAELRLALAPPVEIQEEEPVQVAEADGVPSLSVDAGVDAYSHYVWRGYQIADKLTIQPSATLGFGDTGLALNIWASATAQERGAPSAFEDADELDFTLSYDRSVPWAGSSLGLSVGYIEYTFPRLDGTNHSEEVYGGLSLDHPLAPSVTTYYDFGLADAWYVGAAIAPEVPLDFSGEIPLTISMGLGLSNAAGSFGFNDFTLQASVGLSMGDVAITPSVGFCYADEAVNVDKGSVWGGVGFSYSR
jgi:hypothetical protein